MALIHSQLTDEGETFWTVRSDSELNCGWCLIYLAQIGSRMNGSVVLSSPVSGCNPVH